MLRLREVEWQPGHQIRLLEGGLAYLPALVAAIDAARHEVRLETYIFHRDRSGEWVLAALERAATRGVAVFLLMDAHGTPPLSPVWVQRLQQAGVQWRRYLPLGALGWLLPGRWRRLHRKLCVVDGRVGFCGGINLLDDFFELGHGWQSQPRFDFALRIEGPLVHSMWTTMAQLWRRIHWVSALEEGWDRPAPAPAESPQHARGHRPGVAAALVLRDNLRHRRAIERCYRQAIARARHEVLIANAYFIPGAKLRKALVLAAQRGVRVCLLLPGRYEFFMQFHAGKPLYAELLAAGIEIYEYRAAFLHAKVAVVDGHWLTVGSSNLDPFSLLLAREANVLVDDPVLGGVLRQRILHAMASAAERVHPHSMAAHNLWERLQDRVAYQLMRLTLALTRKKY